MATNSPDLSAPMRAPLPNDSDSAYASSLGMEAPRASYLAPSDRAPSSSQLISAADKQESSAYAAQPGGTDGDSPRRRKRLPLILGVIAGLIALILIIVLPVYFTVIKPKNNVNTAAASPASSGSSSDSGNSGSGNSEPGKPATAAAFTGGDGSTIIKEDGSTFTYSNKFGGFWVSDPKDPFNNGARPNSWTPPLNQSWTWGKDRVFGVNLGGLFVLEPFIVPSLYQKYPGSRDEYSLSQLMGADTANGGFAQLEDHYNTFITEEDIAEIAGAGLNWIRLPIPFWAVDIWNGTEGHSPNTNEPFFAKTSWKYIVRVLGWARKYGLRVNLDLHTLPGSQNGYNHSGKLGQVNFLYGNMGIANAQRAMNYIRVLTEFINRPEWRDVVPVFGIVNEVLTSQIGRPIAGSFYYEVHNMIREITGIGEGKGPYISIHDGFAGLSNWAGFMDGGDRVMLDTHPYFAFGGGAALDPIDTSTNDDDAGGIWPRQACDRWAAGIQSSQRDFGVTVAGEWSNGFNDCGLFLKGVPGSHTYGGDCSVWQDSSNWSQATKAGLKAFAEASMDALGDFFFWTWKIGPSNVSGKVESPLWSYKLGLENGWMPKDPRTSVGKCARLGVNVRPFNGQYQPWATGGAGAGQFSPSVSAAIGTWPPAQISGDSGMLNVNQLPMYATTGTVVSLPGPTGTETVASTGGPIEVSGCDYPDAWNANSVPLPAGACTGTLAPRSAPTPLAKRVASADAGAVTHAPGHIHGRRR
ncbi:hypothetical protein HGRIS_012619 [Hohenbuehelia grisea]|uniref:glucan 1,3-beta-glucosidase n=1 Tax=Hohenbuehelia grisea TaxID=104357 RepID=A0ABR3IST7_9AGAR